MTIILTYLNSGVLIAAARGTDILSLKATSILDSKQRQFNDHISSFTVELIKTYRLSHGLLMSDALIAATSMINNFPLLTKNQSDYRFIPEINLLPYP